MNSSKTSLPVTLCLFLAMAGPMLFLSPVQGATVYQNNFNQNQGVNTGDQYLSTVGFLGDVNPSSTRVFTGGNGAVSPNWALYSYAQQGTTEGFYTAPGAFDPINLATTLNLTLSVDINSTYNPGHVNGYFAVETDNNQWYVSTAAMPTATNNFVTTNLTFNPAASGWDLLATNNPTGSGTDSGATIGAPAPSDLTGNVIAAGFVASHFSGDGTLNFDNFAITGDLSAVPEPSTWALMFVGLMSLLAVNRFRRRAC